MKKLFALLLVAVMTLSIFALASCGDEETSKEASKEESSAVSETASEATSEATSETASEATSEATSETASEVASEDASDASTDAPAGDITETASYKYVSSIDYTKGVTAIVSVDAGVFKMVNTVCALGSNNYVEMVTTTSEGTESMRVLTKDGKSYVFDDASKTYIVSDATDSEEEFTVEALFGDLSYVSSTTEELNGVTYTVDNFKTISGGEDAKFYVDAEGVIKYALMDGAVVGFEVKEGVIEGCFDIPADYTETTMDDIVIDD